MLEMTPSNNLELQAPSGEAERLMLLVEEVGEGEYMESGEGGGVNSCIVIL